MNALITLREPVVLPAAPQPQDPDPAVETGVDPIPNVDEDGHPFGWSHREVAGMRFARWRRDRGDFDDDRIGDEPEPLPPIVREADR